MKRYHPVLVGLHWILALAIVVMLIAGNVNLHDVPNTDPDKVFSLRMHMSIGMTILVLMSVRLVTRLRAQNPPHADIGNDLLNKAGIMAHWGLYVLVFVMCASGIAISVMAGLPDIIFGNSGAPLPETFDIYPPRAAHGIASKLLALLILGHAAAALYHHFIVKDGLLHRMWFGQR